MAVNKNWPNDITQAVKNLDNNAGSRDPDNNAVWSHKYLLYLS